MLFQNMGQLKQNRTFVISENEVNFGLVVNGATRNAQCATFPHFKFITYTL